MIARTPSNPPPGRHRPGDLIGGKYRLVRELGAGGMGTVWVAENQVLEAPVAVKLIRGDEASEQDRARLLREARATARLRHPGIIRVFDFGETDAGDPFIVMELLEGETLAEAIERRTRLGATRAVQTLLPVADALAGAHDKEIVHRDLKPDNVFLARVERRLQPKVLDFGIARFDPGGKASKLTLQGTIMGSPQYMSPEQARGETAVDLRVDVWAFSVMLYETLTGGCPFDGDNYNAVLRAIIEDEPVPVTEVAAGDDALWAILARGLQKRPEERWSGMTELGQALARWLMDAGETVDICGASLEQTWLSGAGGSGDEGSIPPPSGLRALPSVDTLPEGQVAEPPSLRAPRVPAEHGSPVTTTRLVRRSRNVRLALGGVLGAGVLVAGGLLILLARSGPAGEELDERSPSSPSAGAFADGDLDAPPDPAEPPAASAGAEPSPPASASAEEPEPEAAPPVLSATPPPRPARPRPAPRPRPRPAPERKLDDLKVPY